MKTIFKFTALALGTLVFSAGCSSKLLQRYAKLDNVLPADATAADSIQVYATARDIPQPDKPNPFVLTDHGQAAYITALAAKTGASLDDFQAGLFPDMSGYAKAPDVIDNLTFSKRLVITILNNTPFEADRITSLRIGIDLKNLGDQIKIITFDKITTDYETVDLGTVNQADAISGTASASYGLTGGTSSIAGPTQSTTLNNPNGSVVSTTPATTTGAASPTFGAGIGATASRTTTSQVDYKDRYIGLTGYFKDKALILSEESLAGVNLTGNIISDIKFQFTDKAKSTTPTYTTGNFVDKTHNNALQAPDKIKIKMIPVYEPSLPDKVEIPVRYHITLRHVMNDDGRKTVPESDDEITYYTVDKATTANMSLVTRQDLHVKKYFIGTATQQLYIKDTILGGDVAMLFTSYDNCASFLRWLRKTAHAGNNISCGDYVLHADSGVFKTLVDDAQVTLL